jgi:hypothetical protein
MARLLPLAVAPPSPGIEPNNVGEYRGFADETYIRAHHANGRPRQEAKEAAPGGPLASASCIVPFALVPKPIYFRFCPEHKFGVCRRRGVVSAASLPFLPASLPGAARQGRADRFDA